ncbi:MAG TPA: tetratricopeptide repeat protein [Longimicrobiaceae bacterium]|nr:tetratricopeptide repeat protein [Longimicrobiaceae bacterium]
MSNPPRSAATLEELFSLLPALDELEGLRLSLVGAAVPDPGREWDSSGDYATFDKRIVSPERLEAALAESEQALHQYVESLYASLLPLFRSFWAGDGAATARQLIELGQRQEEFGRYRKARDCYDVALSLSLPLAEKGPQIQALRRIARVSISLGDLQEARSYYHRAAELALDADALHAQVVALTGLGNVHTLQGRFAEAEDRYRQAMALLERAPADEAAALELERGQLYNNLANISTRRERLAEAEAWFRQAMEVWAQVDSPFDQAVCCHNLALLREVQGRREESRAIHEQALALPLPSGLRSGIAIDLAESYLKDGQVGAAEAWGREAEEHAIAARSPYFLGRMYQGRGNIARARGDEDGFIFYEKALEIAREKDYPFLEAETLVDYARLRLQAGNVEEAQAYLERAREIFGELGTLQELARAERALGELQARADLPLAAAGD